jgi:hypothetical protein
MKNACIALIASLLLGACQGDPAAMSVVDATDIDLFWNVYDKVTMTKDTLEQDRIIRNEYVDRGSPGLHAMMQAKEYTVKDYREAMTNYPKFWASIRGNTTKARELQADLTEGVTRLKAIYPELRPAKIYFTMGAMRSNGTTLDGLVLIGSEFAMADKNTVTTEFPEWLQGLRAFFDRDPINDLVLLNVHEYVHTQQGPMVDSLLSQCLYEGVAEFVSVTAMGRPSAAPAIAFGKANEDKVRKAFERDVFVNGRTPLWLWSNAKNEFDTRDLGYYIGYAICERYYNAATNKRKAIKDMIELDHSDEAELGAFVDGTGFLSASLEQLYENYDASRPTVVSVSPQLDSSSVVDPKMKRITLTFSQPMDRETRGFDFGPLGEENVLHVQNVLGFSEDGLQFTFEVALTPGRTYQSLVNDRFMSATGIPLKPYLLHFSTRK